MRNIHLPHHVPESIVLIDDLDIKGARRIGLPHSNAHRPSRRKLRRDQRRRVFGNSHIALPVGVTSHRIADGESAANALPGGLLA